MSKDLVRKYLRNKELTKIADKLYKCSKDMTLSNVEEAISLSETIHDMGPDAAIIYNHIYPTGEKLVDILVKLKSSREYKLLVLEEREEEKKRRRIERRKEYLEDEELLKEEEKELDELERMRIISERMRERDKKRRNGRKEREKKEKEERIKKRKEMERVEVERFIKKFSKSK